jgi:hypothetical protein
MAWSFYAIDARLPPFLRLLDGVELPRHRREGASIPRLLDFHTDKDRRRLVPVGVPLAPELHGFVRRRLRAVQGQAINSMNRVAPVPQCVSVRIHVLRELALEAAGLDHII